MDMELFSEMTQSNTGVHKCEQERLLTLIRSLTLSLWEVLGQPLHLTGSLRRVVSWVGVVDHVTEATDELEVGSKGRIPVLTLVKGWVRLPWVSRPHNVVIVVLEHRVLGVCS